MPEYFRGFVPEKGLGWFRMGLGFRMVLGFTMVSDGLRMVLGWFRMVLGFRMV